MSRSPRGRQPSLPSERSPRHTASPPAGPECPPCAICGHGGRGSRVPHHLTHGISVWLCDTHRSDSFMSRRSGREFVERLAGVWAANEMLTGRRNDALEAHLRRIHTATAGRKQPGSYSWPLLRLEAERRFAAGEPPANVIAELRRSYRDGPAMVPSVRTMRRWFTQARWLANASNNRRSQSRPPTRPARPASPWQPFINVVLTGATRTPAQRLSLLRRRP